METSRCTSPRSLTYSNVEHGRLVDGEEVLRLLLLLAHSAGAGETLRLLIDHHRSQRVVPEVLEEGLLLGQMGRLLLFQLEERRAVQERPATGHRWLKCQHPWLLGHWSCEIHEHLAATLNRLKLHASQG